jgi:hypothetical protein
VEEFISMPAKATASPRDMATLSRLMFQGYSGDFEKPANDLRSLRPDLDYFNSLSAEERTRFVDTADKHHVLVRALSVLGAAAIQENSVEARDWCDTAIANERTRIDRAVSFLSPICAALETNGCPVCVIKSLDHWPDLGSDLDLFTTGKPEQVISVMRQHLKAKLEPRSWGDRLANKWNFEIPGLPELVEIHVRYLGQTGEHAAMARRIIERSTVRRVQGKLFQVAAPEERIVVSTLQRMYRHFYFRLCDMADVYALLERNEVNFEELRRAAEVGNIWPGVATFLLLVSRYAEEFGRPTRLPGWVSSAVYSQDIRVSLGGNFLRVPKVPAACLYGSQLLGASLHRDRRAMFRLPLLPPLALSALVAYRVTGSDKGIW